MKQSGLLYFALGVTTVVSIGAVTNQLVPAAPIGVALSDAGITFPDGTLQTTAAAGNPDPPCFDFAQRFVDCGNGTVTDTVTGLIYLKNADCFTSQNWPTANQSAAGLADGSCGLTDGSGAGDWRLQTREEWEGILAPACPSAPGLSGTVQIRAPAATATATAPGPRACCRLSIGRLRPSPPLPRSRGARASTSA